VTGKKWEYGQLYVPQAEIFGGMPKGGLDLAKVNRAGQEGWELISTVPFTQANGVVKGFFMIFKRAVEA
jgi:hypothetical protein